MAASWKGRNGMTSGEEPLAVTPIKDVGFPYQSHIEFGEAGEAIDAALAAFTWQQHMISKRRYARWVDAGSPRGAPPRLRRVPDLGALAGDRGRRPTCAAGSPR